ncbi:MAG TPA: hypothetical protein VE090_01955, partial [Methylomirabilota bacterium]|nr:hypothetical protein [Methylomirabilota bacterium]
MPTKQDEWKSFIKAIGEMIDARFKTFEINLKSYIKDEIKASEARIRKDMATKDDIKNMATKDDIKDMATKQDLQKMEKRLRNDLASKGDIQSLEAKLDKRLAAQEKKILLAKM